jgi:hypothetical protein
MIAREEEGCKGDEGGEGWGLETKADRLGSFVAGREGHRRVSVCCASAIAPKER